MKIKDLLSKYKKENGIDIELYVDSYGFIDVPVKAENELYDIRYSSESERVCIDTVFGNNLAAYLSEKLAEYKSALYYETSGCYADSPGEVTFVRKCIGTLVCSVEAFSYKSNPGGCRYLRVVMKDSLNGNNFEPSTSFIYKNADEMKNDIEWELRKMKKLQETAIENMDESIKRSSELLSII